MHVGREGVRQVSRYAGRQVSRRVDGFFLRHLCVSDVQPSRKGGGVWIPRGGGASEKTHGWGSHLGPPQSRKDINWMGHAIRLVRQIGRQVSSASELCQFRALLCDTTRLAAAYGPAWDSTGVCGVSRRGRIIDQYQGVALRHAKLSHARIHETMCSWGKLHSELERGRCRRGDAKTHESMETSHGCTSMVAACVAATHMAYFS